MTTRAGVAGGGGKDLALTFGHERLITGSPRITS